MLVLSSYFDEEGLPYLLNVRLFRCEPKRPCMTMIGGLDSAGVSTGSWRVYASSMTFFCKLLGEVEKPLLETTLHCDKGIRIAVPPTVARPTARE